MFPAPGGYDRAITVFSPDGRLFQVEYAFETVKRGTLAVGAICEEGVVIAVQEQFAKLQDRSFTKKLFIVDDAIGAAASGYVPDARVLIDIAREYAQFVRLIYDEPPTVEAVTRRISDIKQAFTQQAGVRPFGVSIIFGGLNPDGTPSMFLTDPSGSYTAYFATAIGNKSDEVKEILGKTYRKSLTLDELKKLIVKAIIDVAGRTLDSEVRILEVPRKTRLARILEDQEVKDLLDAVSRGEE